MATPTYPQPLDKIYALGETRLHDWPDYIAQFGLTGEHIPDLIRMATNSSIWEMDADEHPEVYANTHAWRALGQLNAVTAAPALVECFAWIDQYDDDWANEELPVVFKMLGPATIPVLAAYLADRSHGPYARIAASESLGEIGQAYPDSAPECAAEISKVLADHLTTDPSLNGFMISDLLDLRQPSSYPLVEEAYQAGSVDESVVGDWEDFQVEVGLLERRLTKARYGWTDLPAEEDVEIQAEKAQAKKQAQKEKNKHKQEKKSRKQNRKKKK